MKMRLRNLAVVAILAAGCAAGASARGELSFRLETPPRTVRELRQRYDAAQVALLEKLNRADAEHLPRLKALVAPDRFDGEELQYSPLPHFYPDAQRYRKLLVAYLPGQVFGAYEFGQLVRWGPLSSGAAAHPTAPGWYHLNWKSRGRYSTENPEWYMRWYFNFGNRDGKAFHAYTLPGYPASHGCIRLLTRDAQWLYEWGEEWELDGKGWTVLRPGTPVLIVGQYDFGKPAPWRSLEWLTRKVELPAELPAEAPAQMERRAESVDFQLSTPLCGSGNRAQ